jgi:hypothetical protein
VLLRAKESSLIGVALWIQITGTTLFAGDEIKAGRYGEHSNDIWDDLRDAEKIRAIIRAHPTREVGNVVLSAASESVHTALIVGPLIYGPGNGPVNKRSIQAPQIAKTILQDRRGFHFNAGLNRRSTIHVGDLGLLLSTMVNSAVIRTDCKAFILHRQALW